MSTRHSDNKSTRNRFQSIPCICPKCGTKHKRTMLWLGKIPARKYCPTCERTVGDDYTFDSYFFGHKDKDESISFDMY